MPMLEKLGYDTLCEGCGEPREWCEMADNDLCDSCNMPSPEELAEFYAEYKAHKHYGLLRQQHEIDQDLRDAGRGHQIRPQGY